MGIDRIGKHGPPTSSPPKEVRGPATPSAGERPFEVARQAPPPAATPADPIRPPTAALDRLRAGEIDLNGYVDQKIDEATAHLAKLSPVQLEAVRSALRDRIRSDPTFVDLLRTATGQAPELPRDE